MKKINNKGFSLVETLVVTIFIATVLIFLFIQFSNLNSSYEDSFKYNTVEGLYALEDIKEYLENDFEYQLIENELSSKNYIDISDCSIFLDETYCQKLLEFENINNIVVAKNLDSYENIFTNSKEFIEFSSKINNKGKEKYRIIASFNDNTFATIRFGE